MLRRSLTASLKLCFTSMVGVPRNFLLRKSRTAVTGGTSPLPTRMWFLNSLGRVSDRGFQISQIIGNIFILGKRVRVMDYKLYKTPNPFNRKDTSLRCENSIANLLLNFDYDVNAREGISKIVTSPADNEPGFNIVACQSLTRAKGSAAYVFIPEIKQLYLFREAVYPIRDAGKRFLKAGLKGLIFGVEGKGVVCRPITNQDDNYSDVYLRNVLQDDWYHFTGTAQMILEELQKKCVIVLR